METYNQLLELFEQFAINHPQINSYDSGTELEVDLAKYESFPKLFTLIGSAVYTNPAVVASFGFQILDKPAKKDSKIYINQVMSDTFQIATDFIKYLKNKQLINRLTQVTLEPVFYQQDNVLYGFSFNIDIATNFKPQWCEE